MGRWNFCLALAGLALTAAGCRAKNPQSPYDTRALLDAIKSSRNGIETMGLIILSSRAVDGKTTEAEALKTIRPFLSDLRPIVQFGAAVGLLRMEAEEEVRAAAEKMTIFTK